MQFPPYNAGYFELGYFYSFDRNPLNSGLHFDGKYRFCETTFINSSSTVHFASKGIKLEDFVFKAQYTKSSAIEFNANLAYNYSYNNLNQNGLTARIDASYKFGTTKSQSDSVVGQIINNTTLTLNSTVEAGIYGTKENYKFKLNEASVSLKSELDKSKPIERDVDVLITAKNFGAICYELGVSYLNRFNRTGTFLTFCFDPGITANTQVSNVTFFWNLENFKFRDFKADGKLGYNAKDINSSFN